MISNLDAVSIIYKRKYPKVNSTEIYSLLNYLKEK